MTQRLTLLTYSQTPTEDGWGFAPAFMINLDPAAVKVVEFIDGPYVGLVIDANHSYVVEGAYLPWELRVP